MMYKLNGLICCVVVLSLFIGSGNALAKKAQSHEAVVSAINLDVIRVEACVEDGHKCVIAGGSKQINLFDLAEGKVDFAKQVLLPARTKELRLVLGENSTITVDDESLPLDVPSGRHSGLKLKGHRAFGNEGGFLSALSLDFDLRKDIIVHAERIKSKGKGKKHGEDDTIVYSYKLKPVIKVDSAEVIAVPPILKPRSIVTCGGDVIFDEVVQQNSVGRKKLSYSINTEFDDQYCVEVINAGTASVSPARLLIDDKEVFSPSQFTPHMDKISAAVTLSSGGHDLAVRLASNLAFALRVRITKETRRSWEVIVGAEGGNFEVDGVTVDVPTGALTTKTELTVRVEQPPDGSKALAPIVIFGPFQQHFNQPITVTVPLLNDRLSISLSEHIKGYLDFEQKTTVVDLAKAVAQVQIDHFSTLVIYYDITDKSIQEQIDVLNHIAPGIDDYDFSKEFHPFHLFTIDLSRPELRVRALTGPVFGNKYQLQSLSGIVAENGLSESMLVGINGPIFEEPESVDGVKITKLLETVIADGVQHSLYAGTEHRMEFLRFSSGTTASRNRVEPPGSAGFDYNLPRTTVFGSRNPFLTNGNVLSYSITEIATASNSTPLKLTVPTSRTAAGISSDGRTLLLLVTGGNDIADTLKDSWTLAGIIYLNCNGWDCLIPLRLLRLNSDELKTVMSRMIEASQGARGFNMTSAGNLLVNFGASDAVFFDSGSSSSGLVLDTPINMQIASNKRVCPEDGCLVPTMLAITQEQEVNSCPSGNGLYCGSAVSLDVKTLYRCTDGVYLPEKYCDDGCENGSCMSAPASCPDGTGLYCGKSSLDQNTSYLYYCQNGSYQLREMCPEGCEPMPGEEDRCKDIASPVVNSVTPTEAVLNESTIFTVSGQNLPSTLAFWIGECENVEKIGGDSQTSMMFRCTPSYSTGEKSGVLKDAPGGNVLKNFSVTVSGGNSSTPVVYSVTPTKAVRGVSTIFTVSGQSLPVSTLEFLLEDCIGVKLLSGGSSTAMQFSCTPLTTGVMDGLIEQSSGELLKTFAVEVK